MEARGEWPVDEVRGAALGRLGLAAGVIAVVVPSGDGGFAAPPAHEPLVASPALDL